MRRRDFLALAGALAGALLPVAAYPLTDKERLELEREGQKRQEKLDQRRKDYRKQRRRRETTQPPGGPAAPADERARDQWLQDLQKQNRER